MCREQGIPHPHLVVVPLSTLPNWERELAKWAPHMYTVVMKGREASRRAIMKYDAHLPAPAAAANGKRRAKGTRFSVLLTTYEGASVRTFPLW